VTSFGGQVRGIAGAVANETDRLELHLWAQLADLDQRDMTRCVGLAREKIAWMAANLAPRRFTAEARADAAGALRCLERLGFALQGETRRVGEGVYLLMEKEG
jgi:hypothetical protein